MSGEKKNFLVTCSTLSKKNRRYKNGIITFWAAIVPKSKTKGMSFKEIIFYDYYIGKKSWETWENWKEKHESDYKDTWISGFKKGLWFKTVGS